VNKFGESVPVSDFEECGLELVNPFEA